MNRLEAIQKLIEGYKLTHVSFMDNEYVYMQNGMMEFEDTANQSIEEFWDLRQSDYYNKNWSIYKNN